MIEVLRQMVEALEWCHGGEPIGTAEAIKVGKQAIKDLESQEPVAHSVIAGALFDFMGWLTSRKERIVLSSADNASPAVEAITEFARMRNLSLDNAKVQDWHTHPPQRTLVGLTDEEISEVVGGTHNTGSFVRAIEAKLREKNSQHKEKNT